MLNLSVNYGLFGFLRVFGCGCSFGKFSVFGFLHLFGKYLCSACSVVFVEKMWINMFESLWESCVKNLNILWKRKFCTYLVGKVKVLHVVVEKFYCWLYTWIYRGKCRVLHSFHRPYYYYYYLY